MQNNKKRIAMLKFSLILKIFVKSVKKCRLIPLFIDTLNHQATLILAMQFAHLCTNLSSHRSNVYLFISFAFVIKTYNVGQ